MDQSSPEATAPTSTSNATEDTTGRARTDADKPDTAPSETKSAGSPEKPKRSQGLRTMVLRVVLALSGLVMFVGFFLPWMQLGELMEASGFQLILGSGEMADRFFGPQRWVLLTVPVLGTLLVIVAVIGHRIVAWIAVLAGLTVLGFGLLRLLTFFFETTGMGVWLIVSAAFIALAGGLLEIGAARKR